MARPTEKNDCLSRGNVEYWPGVTLRTRVISVVSYFQARSIRCLLPSCVYLVSHAINSDRLVASALSTKPQVVVLRYCHRHKNYRLLLKKNPRTLHLSLKDFFSKILLRIFWLYISIIFFSKLHCSNRWAVKIFYGY